MLFDLVIIGGGPAGVAAGVYASRKKIKTLFIAKNFEGQSTVSSEIQNWIGTIKISGAELSKNLENHLLAYKNDVIDIKKELVENIVKKDSIFEIKTDKDNYQAKTILVSSGSKRKKLEIPGAEKYEGKGVVYCATCDGPLFTDKDVVVIGGGNAGFESVLQLLAYAKSVTLLQRSDKFRADEITIKNISKNPKFKAILNAKISEIKGDNFVKSIVYKNPKTGEEKEIQTEGVFIEIGSIPTTDIVKDLVNLDDYRAIIVDHMTQKTSLEGIWAAGDCTNGLYKQNNIAVGDGIKALENIHQWLQNH
ncbi:MAG: FAD-dependent oxidoreductase [Candidatus Pacebacteria bacterium]|nr:FAD-dependent oxidoreductase [Candidatus Paceibacterota bacterium]